MTGRDDPLADVCATVASYADRLEEQIGELPAPGPSPDLRVRHAEQPEPYGAAGWALMDIWEGVPRLEAWAKYMVAGHPGRRRGGSRGNVDGSLEAIPKLFAGLGQYEQGKAYRFLDGLVGAAMGVAGIDERPRLRHLPPTHGCPYCKRPYLLANMDARPVLVYCPYRPCPGAPDGSPPVALVGTDGQGTPQLEWPDRAETAPDMSDEGPPVG